jgi:hypothetical protein
MPIMASSFSWKVFQLSSITWWAFEKKIQRERDAENSNTIHTLILQVLISLSLITVYSLWVILVHYLMHPWSHLTKQNQPSRVDCVTTRHRTNLSKEINDTVLKYLLTTGKFIFLSCACWKLYPSQSFVGTCSDLLKCTHFHHTCSFFLDCCPGSPLSKGCRRWCTISIPLMHFPNDSTWH